MSDREIGFFFLSAFVIAFGYMAYTMYYCEYSDELVRGPKGGLQQSCVVK